MNDKLIRKLNQLNQSIYAISKESGIPYTTLNELKNKKTSVNNISAEKAYKLCLYLGCTLDEILDDVYLYNNLCGSYHGYSYSWKQNHKKTAVTVTNKNDKKKITKSFSEIISTNPYKFAKAYPETLIDKHIKEMESKRNYDTFFANAQKHRMRSSIH